MSEATKTRLGKLEVRHRPAALDIAVVASPAEADSVVEDALQAGRPRPTVIVTGVSRGPGKARPGFPGASWNPR